MTKRVLIALSIALSAAVLHADQKYLLMFKQPNATDTPQIITDAEVATLGGAVVARASDRIAVSMPEAVVEALRHHPRAKYLQKGILGAGGCEANARRAKRRARRRRQPASTHGPSPLARIEVAAGQGGGT